MGRPWEAIRNLVCWKPLILPGWRSVGLAGKCGLTWWDDGGGSAIGIRFQPRETDSENEFDEGSALWRRIRLIAIFKFPGSSHGMKLDLNCDLGEGEPLSRKIGRASCRERG